MKKMLCLMMLLVASSSLTWAQKADSPIEVSSAWVRLMPPSEKTSAAYMEIQNKTDKPLLLEKASSEGASIVELHYMTHINGIMKMGMARDIIIPAKGKFVFDESGYHIMLIDLKKPLKQGEPFIINLHFKGLDPVAVKAIIQEGQA